MKKLLIAGLACLPMVAIADHHEDPICTHSNVYTIYNEDGDVMDRTTYERKWPLTCQQSQELKYDTLRKLVNSGEAQWKEISGEGEN